MAKPKTETDWIIKRAKESPGPGQYSPKLVRKTSACKISDANPKSDVDLVILRSKETRALQHTPPSELGERKV